MKNRDHYTHSLDYGPTTPFTRSVIFKNNYPKLSKPVPKETKSLLEKIINSLIK